MAYDFSTIDGNDFEMLARDLLNAKFGLDLQSFKAGKDKGIDLRQSTPENKNAIVVQGKHYVKSSFSTLLNDFRNKELPKVTLLNPDRYMIVTSMELNPQEKDQLKAILSPYLLTTNDIFGKEDLNKYLSELPDIETRWYKLWLTSVPVLTKVLQNGILGTNEFVATKILKTTQLYVPCPSYDVAFNILKENKYLLITGQPGVGKTTLAYYLTYNLLANGFQLLHVDTDIAQASKLLSSDPEVKQIVFFDDFLGETYLEINRPKTTESAFVLFLERIMASENKYLILTTRTTIYNNALDKYEKLERMKVNVARREIVLDQYNILDKARILHKHIYFADIPQEHKEEIFDNKQYWKIIDHHNYNPRLIEFVTSKKHIPTDLTTGYLNFVINNLENPKEVWKYFYNEQLNPEERILLHIVFAQTYSAKTADTRIMFSFMLDIEMKNYNYRPGLNPFQSSLKRLLDGTLKKELSAYSDTDRITFINPSLSDFLKHYFFYSAEERHKLLKGASTIEQFEHYKESFFTFENTISGEFVEERSMFGNLLIDRANCLTTYQELKREPNRNNYIKIRIASIANSLYSLNEQTNTRLKQFIHEAVVSYPVENLNVELRDYYCKCLRYAYGNPELFDYVNANWPTIINALFVTCVREEDFETVKELFDELHQDYSKFIENDENVEILSEALKDLADDRTSEMLQTDQATIYSQEDLSNLKRKIMENRESVFKAFHLEDEWYDEDNFFEDLDIDNLIEVNTKRRRNTKSELTNTQKFMNTEEENLVREVELLFCGESDEEFVQKKAKEIGLPF